MFKMNSPLIDLPLPCHMTTMRKRLPTFRVCATILLAATACLRAEVHFEKTRIELRPRPDQEQIEAVFELENRGETPAKILSVTSGCQCLEAKAPTAEIAPGAKERITGIFKTGNFPGLTEKTLQVRISEDGATRNLNLTVAVEMRELIRIEPRTLVWTAGGEKTELTFKVTMDQEESIRLLAVEPSRPGFEIRLETIKEGQEYRVHVKPGSSETPTLGVFRLKTDCKYPRFASPVAFGHIRKQ